MNYVYKNMISPVGQLTLIASDKGLAAVLWENDNPNRVKISKVQEDKNHVLLREVEEQLQEYFKGERKSFSIPLDLKGTEFQKTVWKALLAIPFGETRSYGELARKIQKPKACRAVGSANRKNPVSIIVPCHRVIGATGHLTGFAGGLTVKEKLLSIERGS